MSQRLRESLRVCMFPAVGRDNPFATILSKSLEGEHVEVINYKPVVSAFTSPDVFHIHWPDSVFYPAPRWRIWLKFASLLFVLAVFRARRIPIIWTVHNVGSHERRHRILEPALWRYLLPRLDLAIHMNSGSEAKLKEFAASMQVNTAIPSTFIYHPHYAEYMPPRKDKIQVRENLGLPRDGEVQLIFGQIRSYKGIVEYARAFSQSGRLSSCLVIAGKVIDPIVGKEISDICRADGRIILIDRHSTDEELVSLISAADICVLPYSRLFNSGAAILAVSLGCALLAPRSGTVVDLESHLGSEQIKAFSPPITPDQVDGIIRPQSSLTRNSIEFMSPARIGKLTANAYRSLLRQK